MRCPPGHHAAHRCGANVDTAGTQRREFRFVDARSVVQHHRQPVGELAQQRRGMKAARMRDQMHDPAIANLVAVAERTVDDVASPVLGQALDGR